MVNFFNFFFFGCVCVCEKKQVFFRRSDCEGALFFKSQLFCISVQLLNCKFSFLYVTGEIYPVIVCKQNKNLFDTVQVLDA